MLMTMALLGRFAQPAVTAKKSFTTQAGNKDEVLGHVRRLENQVAVVTGSTAGIGLATARRLAEEGAKVVVSSRKQQKVEKAVDELRAQGHVVHGMTCNTERPDDIAEMMKQAVDVFGRLDFVVANASTSIKLTPMLEITDKDWDKVVQVNIKGTFTTLREGMKHITATSGSGSMVVMSSAAAYVGMSEIAAYNVTKAAQVAMVMNFARVLRKYNIRINTVAPGMIDTKMSRELRTNSPGLSWPFCH